MRDRVSMLNALYGSGPLQIDFKDFARRAELIHATSSRLAWKEASRRSSRSGETHSLGGFTGEVEYFGGLAEFMPYLEAAYWTGVGRQTVWGKGELTAQSLA